jgi:hypothetical protein
LCKHKHETDAGQEDLAIDVTTENEDGGEVRDDGHEEKITENVVAVGINRAGGGGVECCDGEGETT